MDDAQNNHKKRCRSLSGIVHLTLIEDIIYLMSKDTGRFNKFCEKYDMYADGVEKDVIAFLKDKYPDAWKKHLKKLKKIILAIFQLKSQLFQA